MVHHQCCMPSSPYKKTHPSDLQSTWKFQMFFKETDLHCYSRAQIIKLKTTVFPYIFINIRLQYCYNSLIKTLINSHLKKQQLVSPKKLKQKFENKEASISQLYLTIEHISPAQTQQKIKISSGHIP